MREKFVFYFEIVISCLLRHLGSGAYVPVSFLVCQERKGVSSWSAHFLLTVFVSFV